MSVRKITDQDQGGPVGRRQNAHFCEFHEQTFVAASYKPNGDIAMSLKAGKEEFCKVVHTENGRTTIRRIHTMIVQAADGRLHHIRGEKLPDSISLYTGKSQTGEHLAEVLLRPESAKGVPLETTIPSRSFARDVLLVVLGFFFCKLIEFLAEEAALALTMH